MKDWRWLWWPRAAQVHAVLALALVAWAALECFGPVRSQSISTATYDMMQRHRLWASAPDPRILIVDIDERSLAELSAEFGRWPWSRDTLAGVLQHAQAQGARALAFDILFSDPDRVRPGGDTALDAAVRSSGIAFFEAVRLPAKNDAASRLTLDRVPGLGVAPADAASAPHIALILPFMKAMLDAARIGTNTVELDPDGKLRRFAWVEPLHGWRVLSLPAALARSLGSALDTGGEHRLVVWRRQADAYPRVSFSQVMACAEQPARTDCPDLKDRIVIVGVTAPSLHDLVPTPLAASHAGVDILATLIDNAMHQRSYREPGPALRFALTLAALAIAWQATRRRAAGATQIALIALPIGLVLLGHASLHSEWLYLDLMLPAGLALTFLSVVKLHDTLRRQVFGLRSAPIAGHCALATGGEARCAEQLERQVFDLAGRHGLAVSGGVHTAGSWGAGDSCWVLWDIDPALAARFGTALRAAIPAAWVVRFMVSADAERDRHAALAQRAGAVNHTEE
jgi:adenylate cyclase